MTVHALVRNSPTGPENIEVKRNNSGVSCKFSFMALSTVSSARNNVVNLSLIYVFTISYLVDNLAVN